MLILNKSPTRFATHFLRMVRTLCQEYILKGTVHLQEFIVSNMRKEEGTVEIIKDSQLFHQRHIFIKIENTLLIILRMADSNQPHMEKIWSMVIMVDDHIRMSMPELNDEYYLTSVT